MSKDYLAELRQRLLGKRIVAIDPPEAREAICKITTDDGKAFRLHATDLGWWMEDTIQPNGKYGSFHTLMQEYYNHSYELAPQYGFDVPEPTVTYENGKLTLTAPDGKTFDLEDAHLTEWEMKVCAHKLGPRLIGFGALMGDAWRMAFRPGYAGCPPELYVPDMLATEDS